MTDPTAPLTDYLHRLADSTKAVSDLDGVTTCRSSTLMLDKRDVPTRSVLFGRAAAIVLVLAGVGALAVVGRSGHAPEASGGVSEQPAGVPALLWPNQTPPGYEPESIDSDARTVTDAGRLERIYASPDTEIGQGPTLSVMTFDAQQSEPQVDPGAVGLVIRDTQASVWTAHSNQERVRFGPIDGLWYLITGYHIDRNTLIAIAETATPSPDRFGAVIDTTTNPLGLVESATGARFGNTFIPRVSLDQPIRHAAWANGSAYFEYFVYANAGEEVTGGRIGTGHESFDTVRNTTINGSPGFIAEGSNLGGSYVVISWSTSTETITLRSRNMNEVDSLAIAESLRPASKDEWTAESTPTSTTPQ